MAVFRVVFGAGMLSQVRRGVDAGAVLHARAELRRRWRSFAVLGLLVGVVAGVAVASASGARRAAGIFDRYDALNALPDVAVAPNDPRFDAADRRAIAELDEVRFARSFAVTPLVAVIDGVPRSELSAYLPTLPEDFGSREAVFGDDLLVAGRLYDPASADEVLIGDDVADRFDLGLGDVISLTIDESFGPIDGEAPVWNVRVVGVAEDNEDSGIVDVSPAFMGAHGGEFSHVDNLFVWLQPGVSAEDFLAAAGAAIGWDDLATIDFTTEKQDTRRVTRLEAAGLAMFALAVVAAGGALVGQALVRAVTVGAADSATLAALGMGASARRLAITIPTGLTTVVAAVVTIAVGVVTRPLFEIGSSGSTKIGGAPVDPAVLAVALGACMVLTVGVGLVAGWWSTATHPRPTARPALATAALHGGAPVPVAIGAHLALDPGRGQRAVPVRSALVGSVIGILGVVASLTFHSGVEDTLAEPARAGVQARTVVTPNDFYANLSDEQIAAVRDEPAIESSVHATFWRTVPIGPQGISVWSYVELTGSVEPTLLKGRLPREAYELALGPRAFDALDVSVGDTITTGDTDLPQLTVVGRVLVQSDSHQGYDGGGFMTATGAAALAPEGGGEPGVDREDGFYVQWRPGADIDAATARLAATGLTVRDASRPSNFVSLASLRELPIWLGAFLAMMAVATVAHALATTVRRRRHDLAVLSALGVSPRQARRAVAVQATLLAAVGLVVGVPAGIVAGRLLWRTISDTLTLLYVPPLAALAVAIIWPIALGAANLLAWWPARAVARLRPATILRSE